MLPFNLLGGILHFVELGEWAALNVIIGLLNVIISVFLLFGLLFAYRTLKETERHQRLIATQRVVEELQSTEKERAEIIEKILLTIGKIAKSNPNELTGYYEQNSSADEKIFYPGIMQRLFKHGSIFKFQDGVTLEIFNNNDKLKIRKIINSLNRIGFLIEENLIEKEMVFAISALVIIRSWAVCEGYTQEQEDRGGVRYARRVKDLANGASTYVKENPERYTKSGQNGKDLKIYLYHDNMRVCIQLYPPQEKSSGNKQEVVAL